MRYLALLFTFLGSLLCATQRANAVVIIGGSTRNGNLDLTYAQEINPPAPGFFLPKPQVWQNTGTRTLTGPYEDEMSSEPWAGPAPTPVTTDGLANPPSPEGCGGGDCAVFFKAFSGNATDGAATGNLYQDNPATPGLTYVLTGWAGAEANFLATDAQFAVEFRNASSTLIGGATLSLFPTLFVPNGQPFNYKQYSVSAVAPAGTVSVRARASFIGGLGNPAGGGQAFVIDDFTLDAVPEPGCIALAMIGLSGLASLWRRR
jgi:hypothetical protein